MEVVELWDSRGALSCFRPHPPRCVTWTRGNAAIGRPRRDFVVLFPGEIALLVANRSATVGDGPAAKPVSGTAGRVAVRDILRLLHHPEQSKSMTHHCGHHQPLYRMRGLAVRSVSLSHLGWSASDIVVRQRPVPQVRRFVQRVLL